MPGTGGNLLRFAAPTVNSRDKAHLLGELHPIAPRYGLELAQQKPRIAMRFSPEFLEELKARPSGLGGRRAAREAEEGRARVEGAVAVQQGEDAVVLRQRPEGPGSTSPRASNGDIFDFVMETEGVTFPEAVERLAAMAGVPMPRLDARGRGARGAAQDAARRHRAGGEVLRGDACSRAPARKARGYLADRGLEPTTQLQIPPRLRAAASASR